MHAHPWLVAALMSAGLMSSGCVVPQSQYTSCQAQNRMLAEENRAQRAENENLKAHGRDLENRVINAEQEMAKLDEQVQLDRQRLTGYKRETSELHDQFKTVALGPRLPTAVSKQLADLAGRCPQLNLDPATGVGKLDDAALFDAGQAALKPTAEAMLAELGHIMQTPDAAELKVLVVSHADNQRPAGQDVRDRYPNNFHLNTARALAVADLLRRQGLSERRIGIAGYGDAEPAAASAAAGAVARDGRVELFILPADAPVVGWRDLGAGAN